MSKRSLRPGDIVRVGLGEESLGDNRPVLICRVPNIPQSKKIVACANVKDKSFDEQIDSLVELASLFVAGWENIPDAENEGRMLPFSIANIPLALGFGELIELSGVAVETFIPSPDDKKKSESQPSSDAVSFASPALGVVATL
jgi:hypothetical protein